MQPHDWIVGGAIVAIGVAYMGYHLALWIGLQHRGSPQKVEKLDTWPSVAVFIPARNEETTIGRCLDSLLQTRYQGSWEIWVGNDNSEDTTRKVVSGYQNSSIPTHIIDIPASTTHLKGKQHVLAYLAKQTVADICLVVDADCVVSADWVSEMVMHFDSDAVGLVSGPTVVDGSGLLERLQAIDWRYGMGSFQALTELRLPISAVGNNMGWRRAAYEKMGGYEGIPFSLVEDYQLFKSMTEAGFTTRFPAYPTILNRSRAVTSWHTLLRQRRRWLRGALAAHAPAYSQLPYLAQGIITLTLFAVIALWGWAWAAGFWAVKVATDVAFLDGVRRRLTPTESLPWGWLLPHQLYIILAVVLLPLYLYWPGPTVWKGRAIPS